MRKEDLLKTLAGYDARVTATADCYDEIMDNLRLRALHGEGLPYVHIVQENESDGIAANIYTVTGMLKKDGYDVTVRQYPQKGGWYVFLEIS